jgi:phospholipase/carboxylesterase
MLKNTSNTLEKGQPLSKASKALLLLHGRGGHASDLLPLAKAFCDDTFYIAAPEAQNQSWYPYSFMEEEQLNEPWLSSSVDLVTKLIEKTSQFIPLEQVYVVGFSQGACVALETTTRSANKYGGVVAMTGGLIGKKLNKDKYRGNFQGTKVFISNSDKDPHVPLFRLEESKQAMEKLGAEVLLKVYPGRAHVILQDEIDSIKKFIFS